MAQLKLQLCAAVGVETPHLAAALIDVRTLMRLLLSTRMCCYSMLMRVLQCITKGQLLKWLESLSDVEEVFDRDRLHRRPLQGEPPQTAVKCACRSHGHFVSVDRDLVSGL